MYTKVQLIAYAHKVQLKAFAHKSTIMGYIHKSAINSLRTQKYNDLAMYTKVELICYVHKSTIIRLYTQKYNNYIIASSNCNSHISQNTISKLIIRRIW